MRSFYPKPILVFGVFLCVAALGAESYPDTGFAFALESIKASIGDKCGAKEILLKSGPSAGLAEQESAALRKMLGDLGCSVAPLPEGAWDNHTREEIRDNVREKTGTRLAVSVRAEQRTSTQVRFLLTWTDGCHGGEDRIDLQRTDDRWEYAWERDSDGNITMSAIEVHMASHCDAI